MPGSRRRGGWSLGAWCAIVRTLVLPFRMLSQEEVRGTKGRFVPDPCQNGRKTVRNDGHWWTT